MVEIPYILKLLLFVSPVVNFVAALIIYRLLCFLEHSYVVSSVALKGLGEKHCDLFLTFKCFFALFGFSAVLFLASLYFYTSTFPAIVSFLRTPLFWLGKAALLIRLLDKLIVYREVKRLDNSITARECLFAGGPLALLSSKTGSYGAQVFLTTPTQFGAASKAERLMHIDTADALSKRYVDTLADSGHLKFSTEEAASVEASAKAINTHFGVAIHYSHSKRMFNLGATSDGSRVPRTFYGYDAHLRKTFEGKTEFVNINNRVLAGSPEKGQSIVTNAVQLREFSVNDVVHINALDSRLYRSLNLDLFGEELLGLLGRIEARNRDVFRSISYAVNEKELLAILSEANRSGLVNILDLRTIAGKLPGCISIATGLIV